MATGKILMNYKLRILLKEILKEPLMNVVGYLNNNQYIYPKFKNDDC
jgi:hypothetical protein